MNKGRHELGLGIYPHESEVSFALIDTKPVGKTTATEGVERLGFFSITGRFEITPFQPSKHLLLLLSDVMSACDDTGFGLRLGIQPPTVETTSFDGIALIEQRATSAGCESVSDFCANAGIRVVEISGREHRRQQVRGWVRDWWCIGAVGFERRSAADDERFRLFSKPTQLAVAAAFQD